MSKLFIRIRCLEKNEKNDVTIALNVLCAKKEKTCPTYISKHKSNREKKNYCFNDFKQRQTIALSCSQKTINIIKRNNI